MFAHFSRGALAGASDDVASCVGIDSVLLPSTPSLLEKMTLRRKLLGPLVSLLLVVPLLLL